MVDADIYPKGDVTRDDSQRRFLAQHNVTMLDGATLGDSRSQSKPRYVVAVVDPATTTGCMHFVTVKACQAFLLLVD